MKLEHIGIAVKSIDERLKIWRDILGLRLISLEEVPDQKVRLAVLDINGTHIELLEPTSDESPVAKFIKKKGEGIHHLCFCVKNIEKVLKEMKRRNIRLIDEVPKKGASGKNIAFIHPRTIGGVLIEISEEV